MNPPIPQPTSEEIEKKFNYQEAQFKSTEEFLKILRGFIEKHRAIMAPFMFSCAFYGNPCITFDCTFENKDQQRNIASAFGKDGWTRHKDSYTCGRINWKKTVDGVALHIDGAEHISPNLIEEVKL